MEQISVSIPPQLKCTLSVCPQGGKQESTMEKLQSISGETANAFWYGISSIMKRTCNAHCLLHGVAEDNGSVTYCTEITEKVTTSLGITRATSSSLETAMSLKTRATSLRTSHDTTPSSEGNLLCGSKSDTVEISIESCKAKSDLVESSVIGFKDCVYLRADLCVHSSLQLDTIWSISLRMIAVGSIF